jgi:hypothetical protein
VGLKDAGLPDIKAPLVDGKFSFQIFHTTPRFDVRANVVVDAQTNVLLFTNYTNGELTAVDEFTVKQTFEDYRPYIELYCTNKKCGLLYHLWSHVMQLTKVLGVSGAWSINPVGLILEGAKVKHYIIHNHWDTEKSHIYTLRNSNAKPIEVPMIDFSTMDKTRLTNRVQMLVTFS